MPEFPWRSKGFWGSLLIILAGIYSLLTGDYQNAAVLIGAGLALMGIRHAME